MTWFPLGPAELKVPVRLPSQDVLEMDEHVRCVHESGLPEVKISRHSHMEAEIMNIY